MDITIIPWCLNDVKKEVQIDRIIPLGVLSISSFLKSNKHNVTILDYNLPEYVNDSIEEFADKLITNRSQVYGFSVASGVLHTSLYLAEKVKNKVKDTHIIFGGPHATINHEKLLEYFDFIDIVVRSEGEFTFLDLVNALEKGSDLKNVKGITYRENNSIIVNESREYILNMDDLMIPDYSGYPIKAMLDSFLPLEIGRGCPYSCSYCSTSVFWGRHYRVKSVEKVINEITELRKKYKINRFYFRHDQLIKNTEWIYSFCDEIITKKISIKWQCSARIDTINHELVKRMKQAGCIGIEIGLESGSPKTLNAIKKSYSNKGVYEKLKMINDEDINTILFFMIGFPIEENEDINLTLSLILKASNVLNKNGFVQLRALIPFPGTKIVKENKELLEFCDRRISEKNRLQYTSTLIEIAKKDSELFPEFYYLKNKNNITIDELLFLESFITRIVQFFNLNFTHSFKWLINYCNFDFDQLKKIWDEAVKSEWYSDNWEEKNMPNLLKEVFLYISKLVDYQLDFLFQILEYENAIYTCRINYTFCDMTKNTGEIRFNDIYYLNPNIILKEFDYEISWIITNIENEIKNRQITEIPIQKSYYLMLATSFTGTQIFKIDNKAKYFLSSFNGKDTLNRIIQHINIDENITEDFITQVKTVYQKGLIIKR